MSSAKKEILRRIRKGLSDVPEGAVPEDAEVFRTYRRSGDLPEKEAADLFARRAGAYRATVRRVEPERLADAISQACQVQKVKRLVVPEGVPDSWLPDGIELMHDRPGVPLTHRQLDSSDGVITTCALAVAQTGTIVLDGGKGQGRRALTLLPDYHLCIVQAGQIVELLPEAFEQLESAIIEEGRPLTFISGPSATSDIELNRVEGVHGPRRLEVLIVD